MYQNQNKHHSSVKQISSDKWFSSLVEVCTCVCIADGLHQSSWQKSSGLRCRAEGIGYTSTRTHTSIRAITSSDVSVTHPTHVVELSPPVTPVLPSCTQDAQTLVHSRASRTQCVYQLLYISFAKLTPLNKNGCQQNCTPAQETIHFSFSKMRFIPASNTQTNIIFS